MVRINIITQPIKGAFTFIALKENNMTKTKSAVPSLFQTFPMFSSRSVGFDDIFESLNAFVNSDSSTYPPYNITKTGDVYKIVIAAAGFSKEDIFVELDKNELIVKSKIVVATDEEPGDTTYIYRGLARRDFILRFKVADNVEIGEAKFRDGLLTISLTHIQPEDKKPKLIPIM